MSSAASTIEAAGVSIYNAVRNLDDGIDRMPESRGWAGQAQDAASKMFDRATKRSSTFKNYTEAFATALQTGTASIGKARSELLAKADEIDGGPLNVTDQWVVLIDPAGMSAEKAAELQKEAEAAQEEINGLAHAVDEADASAARQLVVARAGEGAIFTNLEYGPPGPVPPVPGDDVPDPSAAEGRQFQEIARAQDMASSVRDVSHSVDKDGNQITTFTMLDGSKQVTTEYIDQGLPSEQVYPAGTVTVLHTDKTGKTVSLTSTIPREDGGKSTEVWYGNGTHVVMSETADGVRTGSCTTPDGRHSVLPDSFFNDPISTLAGGALSGLETKAHKGIPGLSTAELEKVKAGAKWGGPALGIATMAYNMVSADTLHDRCVAAWSGGVGLAGGLATTVVVGAIPGVGPIAAMGANTAGGFVFGYVGELVGNVMCPP
ncbi:hypothetical protein [Mycobacterium sp. 3519A]|uniref:hypothetical protein n=1 Tax=Mycobacterium sp. 3519A TaxID=2057184 RepID=UPI000C7BB880|nr:hypothetical protein [Mycobacterium sp. 3519A]